MLQKMATQSLLFFYSVFWFIEAHLGLLNPLERIKTRRGDLGLNLSALSSVSASVSRHTPPKVYGENVRSKLCR